MFAQKVVVKQLARFRREARQNNKVPYARNCREAAEGGDLTLHKGLIGREEDADNHAYWERWKKSREASREVWYRMRAEVAKARGETVQSPVHEGTTKRRIMPKRVIEENSKSRYWNRWRRKEDSRKHLSFKKRQTVFLQARKRGK